MTSLFDEADTSNDGKISIDEYLTLTKNYGIEVHFINIIIIINNTTIIIRISIIVIPIRLVVTLPQLPGPSPSPATMFSAHRGRHPTSYGRSCRCQWRTFQEWFYSPRQGNNDNDDLCNIATSIDNSEGNIKCWSFCCCCENGNSKRNILTLDRTSDVKFLSFRIPTCSVSLTVWTLRVTTIGMRRLK